MKTLESGRPVDQKNNFITTGYSKNESLISPYNFAASTKISKEKMKTFKSSLSGKSVEPGDSVHGFQSLHRPHRMNKLEMDSLLVDLCFIHVATLTKKQFLILCSTDQCSFIVTCLAPSGPHKTVSQQQLVTECWARLDCADEAR